uniref:Golgin subfamily A member 7/ERF4 domain-containing protein n=1 Tax=Panagrolaimus sp. ES5 TaxID=591445 RepID=A0AC34EZB5_9BILA
MTTNILLDSCRKIYVERDYSNGTGVAFQREMPLQLEGIIDYRIYEETITAINALFAEIEEVCIGSMLETFVSCGTCYINRYFVPTRYEKQLVKIRQYIDDRNKSVLIRSGICITDPMERGLRVLEISLLSTGQVSAQVVTQLSKQPSAIEEV